MSSRLLRQIPDRLFPGQANTRQGGIFVHVFCLKIGGRTGPLQALGLSKVFIMCAIFSGLPLRKPREFSLHVKCRAAYRYDKDLVATLPSGVSLGGVGVRGTRSFSNALLKERDFSCGLFECVALGFSRISSVGSGVPTTVRKSLRG